MLHRVTNNAIDLLLCSAINPSVFFSLCVLTDRPHHICTAFLLTDRGREVNRHKGHGRY